LFLLIESLKSAFYLFEKEFSANPKIFLPRENLLFTPSATCQRTEDIKSIRFLISLRGGGGGGGGIYKMDVCFAITINKRKRFEIN